ncbi:sensor histidine kinase [Flavobacterium ustbae]|uniref:sensor histidine kinase n=1 Tax=Flavobacterium ustbae TaxID=2488790 RepID=UPI0013DE5B1A|nr:ATP-binding protein [Flavobacterium ustbae]
MIQDQSPLNDEFYFVPKTALGDALRKADWSQSRLGPPGQWPAALRSTLGMLLCSKLPMFVWWGKDHLQFCNDSGLENFSKDRPSQGQPGRQSAGLWSLFGPAVTKIMHPDALQSIQEGLFPMQEKIFLNGRLCVFNYTPVFGEGPMIQGVAAICSEHEDHAHELRALIDAAPFPIGVYEGPQMRIRMLNQSIIDAWGKGGDLVGKTYFEVLPELESQEIYPLLQQVYNSGEPYHAKNQRVDLQRDGKLQTFYFNYSFTPLFDDKGRVYGVMNTAADVTDLNIARLKMAQSQENFRSLIMQAPVSMCLMLGPSHTVEIANEHMVNLWGKDRQEVMQRPIFEGLPDAREQGLEGLLDQVFKTGKTFTASEMPVHLIRFGTPEVVYQNFIYEPYRDGSGEVLGVIAISNNVTEQVLARQKVEELIKVRTEMLVEANENLARSNADLAQFAYIASHDLQEPLRKISIFSQMLQDKAGPMLNSRSQEHLRKIGQSAARMQSLVQDVLAFSQLNKAADSFSMVDPNQIIVEILADFELLIEESGAVFEISDIPEIPGQPLQLSQLLGNLIGNALKFQREGCTPVIKITAAKADKAEKLSNHLIAEADYVKITVSDNGIGFLPEEADKIFGVFQRLHSKSQFEGTGIGLSICKKIVDNHHGAISAQGSSQKGAVFSIYLPLEINSLLPPAAERYLF